MRRKRERSIQPKTNDGGKEKIYRMITPRVWHLISGRYSKSIEGLGFRVTAKHDGFGDG